MSVRAPVGNLNITPVQMCLGRGVCSIRANNGNQDFIYYLMKHSMGQLLSKESGTVFGSVNRNDISGLDIDVPEDSEKQRKIARYLAVIDEKIEANKQINDNLAKQLQLVFSNMFLAEDSKLWQKKKLGEYLSLERGLSYKGQFLSDTSGVPMINLGNILPNSGFRPEKLKFYTGEFKSKVVVHPGDIVVANTDLTQAREVLGSAIMVPDIGYPTIICSHHISIVRNCSLSKYFLFGMLNAPQYRERVVGFATGTTVLALPTEVILECEFALPPIEKVEQFDSIASPIHQLIEQNRIESDNLALLRDSLLPKLMSGELDVSDVEV